MRAKITKLYKFWKMNGFLLTISLILNKLGITTPVIGSKVSLPQHYDLATTPLRTYSISDDGAGRINLITDSVGKGSLFGGVGTALIIAVLLANKKNYPLRIITRTESASPDSVEHVLSLYDVELESDLEFKFAPMGENNYEVDIGSRDVFITTSWWTTASTLDNVPTDKIIYLLQEDERMFYSHGDERLRCESVMKNTEIKFLINTKLLNDSLGVESFNGVVKNSMWFEPAFPKNIYFPRDKSNNNKKNLFFYARPNNGRNLYNTGLRAIEQAIASNVIDLNLWDIYFVGKGIPATKLGGEYSPIICEGLSWSEYSELIGNMDVGLSLMYTPHPSYPPLDLAASGAVVVTNRFENKQTLDNYSQNIIMSDLDSYSLVEAIRQAIELSHNEELKNKNFLANGLSTNWQESLDDVILKLSEVI